MNTIRKITISHDVGSIPVSVDITTDKDSSSIKFYTANRIRFEGNDDDGLISKFFSSIIEELHRSKVGEALPTAQAISTSVASSPATSYMPYMNTSDIQLIGLSEE